MLSLSADPHLHAVFRQSGGLEVALSILHQAMAAPSSTEQQVSISSLPLNL